MINEVSKHSYWIYSNGNSFWGLGVNLYNEIPLECTIEIHKETDINKKIQWHADKLIEIAKKEADEAAKKKK